MVERISGYKQKIEEELWKVQLNRMHFFFEIYEDAGYIIVRTCKADG